MRRRISGPFARTSAEIRPCAVAMVIGPFFIVSRRWGLRRLWVRYDRLGVIRDAFTIRAAGVICSCILYHDTR
jgi:hypothetical protein